MNILPFVAVSLLFIIPPLTGAVILVFATKKLLNEINKIKKMNEQELLEYNKKIKNENLRFTKLAYRCFIVGFPVFAFIINIVFAFVFNDFDLKHFINGFFFSSLPAYLFGILFFKSLKLN